MGYGMAVDPSRGLVIVSGYADRKLYVYRLADGALVRSIGGQGTGEGCFDWAVGGLCMTPAGTVIVAEATNSRLQEVNIDSDDPGRVHVRFLGVGVLVAPNDVSCNWSVVAASETNSNRVTVLSWPDGGTVGRFGGYGSGAGQLRRPRGVCLLADSTCVAVADRDNNRVCVFTVSGDYVGAVAVGSVPRDVVECDVGAAFIVAYSGDNTLCKVSRVGGGAALAPLGKKGAALGQLNAPSALAILPGAGAGDGVQVLVLEADNSRVQIFRG